MSNPYERLDTILFILVTFGYTDAVQQVAFYAVQEVIEGVTGKYASYAEITDAMRFL